MGRGEHGQTFATTNIYCIVLDKKMAQMKRRLEVVAQLFFYVRRTSGHLPDFSRMLVFTSTPGQQLHGCRCEQPRHTTSLDSTFRRQGTPGHTLHPLAPGPGCLLVPFPSYAAAFIAGLPCGFAPAYSTLVSIPSTGPTALSFACCCLGQFPRVALVYLF